MTDSLSDRCAHGHGEPVVADLVLERGCVALPSEMRVVQPVCTHHLGRSSPLGRSDIVWRDECYPIYDAAGNFRGVFRG